MTLSMKYFIPTMKRFVAIDNPIIKTLLGKWQFRKTNKTTRIPKIEKKI